LRGRQPGKEAGASVQVAKEEEKAQERVEQGALVGKRESLRNLNQD
jgi:hypothetical protein